MITQFIREHDDSYVVTFPEDHELQCEICFESFCPRCGTDDYKDTGWFVCCNCLDNPESIIDALLEVN